MILSSHYESSKEYVVVISKSTVFRVLIGGIPLSILSCFISYDPCTCGPSRGLPLPIVAPHTPLYFWVLSFFIDVLIWGTIANFIYRSIRTVDLYP